MDNSPKAADIIAEHERSVARVRRVRDLALNALGLLTVLVAIFGLAMLAVGFGQ